MHSTTRDITDSPTLRKNALGTFSLVVFVLGAAAPLTIIAGFAPLGLMAGGEGLVAGFLIPGIVYLIFAVGFTAMSRHFNGYGAFYAYISRGLSPLVGGAAGTVAYLGYLGGQIGFTASAAVFAAFTVEALFGVSIPWLAYAIAFTVIVAILSYRSVHIGARILAVLLAGEVAVLVVFCVAVLARGGYAGLSLNAFSPEVVFSAALPSVFVLTFAAFVGFEQTAIYSEEVRDPKRTVSRATYIAVAGLGVGYTFCAWVVVQAVGMERLPELLAGDPSSLVFVLNNEYAGAAMTTVMQVLIVTSFFAGILALQNACSRYLFALARGGIAPRYLDRVGVKTGVPSTANVVHATLTGAIILIFGLLGADPYTQVVAWTNSPTIIAVLAMQIVTSIAVIRFFRENAHGESIWSRMVAPVVAAALLTAALILLVSQMGNLTLLDAAGNSIVIAPLIVGALYGYLRASWLRRNRPDEFAMDVAATIEQPADRP
jgi:amino acid transporter